MSDCRKTPKEFNDMCDDVIDEILCRLKLEDLANISDTSKRLKIIAGSVFSRKYANHLVAIDAFDHSLECRYDERLIMYNDKPIVRISDARVWFKLLRNFGESIKYVRIQSQSERFNEMNIPDAWKHVIKHVFEYSADSLEVLECCAYKYFPLNKPLPKLQKLFGGSPLKALELMPNLQSLCISDCPETLARTLATRFSKLENINMYIDGENVHPFISFLQVNRQIKHLSLRSIQVPDSDLGLIYSSIHENLTKLKSLNIIVSFKSKGATGLRSYRFKEIDSFSFLCFGNSDIIQHFESFEFNDLKFLYLHCMDAENIHWKHFVLRNKKLKKVKLRHNFQDSVNINIVHFLLSELPELVTIVIQIYTRRDEECKKIEEKFKEILGSEWFPSRDVESYLSNLSTAPKFHLTFRRIQNA